MARVRKKIAKLGTHHSRTPDGRAVVVDITPERVRGWVEKDAKLRACGIRVPVPYGHQLSALPADPLLTDSLGFSESRYNAGESVQLEQDADGDLTAVLDCPGVEERDGRLVGTAELPDGRTVTTAIGDVSPFIASSWTDGQGRVWEDFVAHVALTPRPVWADQPGFESLAMSAAKPLDGVYLGATMPDPTKKPGEKNDETKPGEKKPTGSEDKDLVEELTQPADDDADGETVCDDDPANSPMAGPDADRVSRIVASLAEFGVPLPPDTTPENILEKIDGALFVAKAMKAQMGQQTQQQPPAKPRETPTPAPSPAVMMSALPPAAQRILRDDFKRTRKTQLDKVEAMVGRNLPIHVVNRIKAEIGGVKLGLDVTGEIRPGTVPLETALGWLDDALPGADDPALLLSAATPAPSPVAKPGEKLVKHPASGMMVTESQLKEIQEQGRRG